MIEGIILAIGAGLMLGLYALPEKFTKDFKFENTWGLFFMLTMFLVPILASFSLINNFSSVFAAVPTDILLKMAAASVLWGGRGDDVGESDQSYWPIARVFFIHRYSHFSGIRAPVFS